MKRVLHVVNRMNYGGIETFIMNIYRNINRDEVQFDFAAIGEGIYDEEIRKLGGKIYYLPKRSDGIIKYRKIWDDFLKKNKYETIHMHVSSLSNIEPLKIAYKNKIPNRYIHSHNIYQQGVIHNILNKLNRLVIKKYATRFFACSEEAAKYCFKNINTQIIKNGINAKEYIFNNDFRNEYRKIFGISNNTTAYINIGRLTYQKNHEFLLKIFKEILKKDSDSKLFLIGEGELEDSLKEEVENLQIEDNVEFLGVRSDINKMLQAMDAFIFPSLYEGLGIVAIEAQATGMNTFVSDKVPKEVVVTNLVTYLNLRQSPEEWANKIISKLSEENYRSNQYDNIKKYGYDIIETTNILYNYYKV